MISRGRTRYDAQLRWKNENPEPDLLGYAIVMRRTTSPDWEKEIFVGNVTEYTFKDVSIDDVVFGVKAIDNKVNAITDRAVVVMSSYADSTFADAPTPGIFHDITITNLTGSVASTAYAIETSGSGGTAKNSSSGQEHYNLKFTNVNITSGKGFTIYNLKGSAANTLFSNVTSSAGTFVYSGSLLTSANFVGCSPAPTAK